MVVTGIEASGVDVPFGEALELPHQQNSLSIEYVGIHLADPAENQYRDRLEPYDEAWVEAGTQRTALYPNLPPGSYTFRVTASNSSGVWNEEAPLFRSPYGRPGGGPRRCFLFMVCCSLWVFTG